MCVVSINFCCVTNHPKTWCLKTIVYLIHNSLWELVGWVFFWSGLDQIIWGDLGWALMYLVSWQDGWRPNVLGRILKWSLITCVFLLSLYLAWGWELQFASLNRIWQRQRDFTGVIKVPGQMTLSQLKEGLSWVGLTQSGKPFKRGPGGLRWNNWTLLAYFEEAAAMLWEGHITRTMGVLRSWVQALPDSQ